jgi:hypothetical protein
MNLIFVHGRAQGEFDEKDLRDEWIATLKQGLAKSGLMLPIPEENIKFPYYGKLLDQLVIDYDTPVKEIVQKGAAGQETKDARFIHDLLKEVADNANISNEQIAEENPELVTEKSPLNWGWVQAILRAIDTHTPWGESSIKQFTYDVFLYLTINEIKNEINRKVKKALNDEPCVVVGHSLGTVVSYNLLRDIDSLKICKFITVGSPLGLNAVKRYLRTPIMMPKSVKNGWFNAYDDRDVVALNALDESHFNIDPAIENKSNVKNHTDNRHGIKGYLDDKDVAKQIYDALINGVC